MAKKVVKVINKPKLVKETCLNLIKAIINENYSEADEHLKNLVKKNIIRKRRKIDKETNLF